VCRFDFGVFGLVRPQTARLNVVEAGDVPPGPCRRAELRFLDSQGNTLAQSVECLTPGHVTSGGSSTLTVVPSQSTPPGTYPLTIQGTGTSTSHSIAFTLNVTGI
jgi:hypothetical protein